MRPLITLLAVLFATFQLMAEPSVDVCASDSTSNFHQNVTASNRQQNQTTLSVIYTGNEIHVNDVPDGSLLYIYSITGARIAQLTVHDNKVTLNCTLTKGIYIIRVNNRAAKITVR